MKCNRCKAESGPNDVCRSCVEKEKISIFDSPEDAAKNIESKTPGIISIWHVVRFGDKFILAGHINCEHCAYCKEGGPYVGKLQAVSGPHDPREMYPEEKDDE